MTKKSKLLFIVIMLLLSVNQTYAQDNEMQEKIYYGISFFVTLALGPVCAIHFVKLGLKFINLGDDDRQSSQGKEILLKLAGLVVGTIVGFGAIPFVKNVLISLV